jgi:hypothetical protein
VNMLAYIIGEYVLAESDHLQDKWNDRLTGDDLTRIAEEIACINSTKLYNEAA